MYSTYASSSACLEPEDITENLSRERYQGVVKVHSARPTSAMHMHMDMPTSAAMTPTDMPPLTGLRFVMTEHLPVINQLRCDIHINIIPALHSKECLCLKNARGHRELQMNVWFIQLVMHCNAKGYGFCVTCIEISLTIYKKDKDTYTIVYLTSPGPSNFGNYPNFKIKSTIRLLVFCYI